MLLVAIFCLLSSYFYEDKRHTTKTFSILIIASLALFSAHWVTYFAAIFIIATAVTELDFLQTLAAIIRKDKNYFEFKKDSLSAIEKIKQKTDEYIEEDLIAGASSKSDKPLNLSTITGLSRIESTKLSLDIEEKALDFLEKKHGVIERNVRFRKSEKTVIFDGVISNRKRLPDKVFEIKWIRSQEFFHGFMRYSMSGAKKSLEEYQEITGEKPELYLMIVINPRISLQDEKVEIFYKKAREIGFNLSIHTLTDIGFKTVD